VHDSFPNALKTRLNWSTNVNDKRNALWQVVLGSMDPVFCVILSLGLWLDMNLHKNVSASWIIPVCVFVFGQRWIAFWWLESKGDSSDNIWSEDIQAGGIRTNGHAW
jgi:hypothetical protein